MNDLFDDSWLAPATFRPSICIYIHKLASFQVLEQLLESTTYHAWCVYMSIIMDEMDLTIRRLCRSPADADACIFWHKKNVEKLLPPDRDQDDKFRQLLGLLDKQPAFPLPRRWWIWCMQTNACKWLNHQADSSRQSYPCSYHTHQPAISPRNADAMHDPWPSSRHPSRSISVILFFSLT